jgi:hypothetical protein
VEGAGPDGGKYELAEPHFSATVQLPNGAGDLADGEMARIKFHSSRSVTLFNELRGAVERWARKFGA